jgi:thymidine phosphorylase
MSTIVDQIGCCIAAQNDAIAPADGLLYAIRDVTNTVDSIPLITASIVSKKAAEGLKALVLDVKCGQAAFMKTESQATELAQSMVRVAQGLGIKTMAQITDMNQPIGTHIGNALEVIESVHVLNGKGPQDTINLVAMQGGALLWLLGRCESEQEGRRLIIESLNDGRAAEKFQQMCVAQGASQSVAKELLQSPSDVLSQASHVTEIQSQEDGWVESIDSMVLAEIARVHGAGRFAIEDEIDPAVGFILNVVKGEQVRSGQKWIEFHHNQPLNETQRENLVNALTVASIQTQPIERLIKVIQ